MYLDIDQIPSKEIMRKKWANPHQTDFPFDSIIYNLHQVFNGEYYGEIIKRVGQFMGRL